jgi:hypothetical protein
MKARQLLGAGAVVVICAGTVIAASAIFAPALQADNGKDQDKDKDKDKQKDNKNNGEEARIRIGFEVAPVPLNLARRDRDLVGLGSYIVNTQGECNGCHSQGPQTQYLPGGNPYFGQPEQTNPATYLGGGRSFGEFPGPGGPEIVSRNLTPDADGVPIGGDTFEEFLYTMRTGHDPDQLHPNLPPPFRGDLLQIMPWPAYANMSDRDLRAIYEYLSAIPCLVSADHPC